MNFQLEGKNALVSGSTDGIGKAVALLLAEMGANVTLLSRTKQKLTAVLAQLAKHQSQQHDYLVADFFDATSVKETVKNYLNESDKHFDILINNTGGPPLGAMLEKEGTVLLKYMSQHLVCFHLLAQLVVPDMRANSYGRIINITSNAAKQPLPNMGISNTIRGAISNWSKTLANELGNGITVNCILPGPTDTKELRGIIEGKAKKSGRSVEEVYKVLHSKVPLGRLADPREIANVVAFIASPLASFVNGINLVVDGGKTGSV